MRGGGKRETGGKKQQQQRQHTSVLSANERWDLREGLIHVGNYTKREEGALVLTFQHC
jgi:hypothetical protein